MDCVDGCYLNDLMLQIGSYKMGRAAGADTKRGASLILMLFSIMLIVAAVTQLTFFNVVAIVLISARSGDQCTEINGEEYAE